MMLKRQSAGPVRDFVHRALIGLVLAAAVNLAWLLAYAFVEPSASEHKEMRQENVP